jgi:hypothetical protein
MGKDVFGNQPTAPEGVHFRRNIWVWPTLANLCCDIAPFQTWRCRDWYSHEGHGLKAKHAIRLAEKLQKRIDDGSVAKYIAREVDADEQYNCDLEDVQEFIAFLRTCGGFRIT